MHGLIYFICDNSFFFNESREIKDVCHLQIDTKFRCRSHPQMALDFLNWLCYQNLAHQPKDYND